MNPSKKDCWILCPSTRIPGKYYYFNVGTGEAAWSINEIERGMTSRPNFAHADKWHTYPEPVSPPEDGAWNYQPTFRSIHQPMHSFSQAPFGKYLPPMVDIPQPTMGWPVTSPMFVKTPTVSMPMFEPSWPSFGARTKIPDKNPFQMNPYEMPFNVSKSFTQPQTVSKSFTQPQTRQVFAPKSNNFLQQAQFPFNIRRTDNNDTTYVKEPLIKKLSTQERSETFIPNNLNDAKIRNNIGEDLSKLKHTCNCMFSKSKDKVNSWLSISQEDLTVFNQKSENFLLKTGGLSKSIPNLTDIANSDHSSNLSLKNSFIFPLRKTTSKELSSNVCETPLKSAKQFETSKSGDKVPSELPSREDLRYVLLAKRKRSYSESSTAPTSNTNGRKIKTRYTDEEPKEVVPKKRVTFALGVEGSTAAAEDYNYPDDSALMDHEGNGAGATEADSTQPCYVIADLEVLLTDFQLLEDYVMSESAHWLVVPAESARAVQGAGRGAGGGAGAGGGGARVAHARRLARLLAAPPPYLIVLTEECETEDNATGSDPALACGWRMMSQGYSVVFVTNNSELYNSAVTSGLECYTPEEVKDYINTPKPEVSFDIKRIDPKDDQVKLQNCGKTKIQDCHRDTFTTDRPTNDMSNDPIVPVNMSRKQLFGNTDPQEKCFFHADQQKSTITRKFSLVSLKTTENQQNNKDFLSDPSLISRDIEKLNLDNSTEQRNERLAANKQCDGTKQNTHSNFKSFAQTTRDKSLLLKNGDTTQQLDHTATKKIKNINIYNLNDLIKDFTLKSREVEDRILSKMDECVCWFTQIMEDALSDILEESSNDVERGRAPLQSLLSSLREQRGDQRTVMELTHKLDAALACLYKPRGDNVMVCLDLRPYEFMKVLGYGTLLIKCLLATDESNVRLQSAEHSLSTLFTAVHTEDAGGPLSPRAASPRTASPHRSGSDTQKTRRGDYVKDPFEVLEYLQKHYPEWKSVEQQQLAENTNTKENVPDAGQEKQNPHSQEKRGPKIVRTFGKTVNLLKFSRGKQMALNCLNEDNAKNTKDNETKDRMTPGEENQKLTGPKLLKKLAEHSLNLPPQMREIDVEKREKINKELLDMVDKMVSCVDLTKSVTKFYDLESIVVKNGNGNNSSETKETVSKSNSSEKIDKHTDNKINKPSPVSQPLDLDILDYSDIEESVCQETDLVEINDENSPESHCEVTTTNNQALSADKGLSPTDGSGESLDNIDPSTWNQGYSMIQVFLINLSKTFNTLHDFIKDSMKALRSNPTDAEKKIWYQKAVYAESNVENMINSLKGIINRESSDETAVAPFIMKSGSPAQQDKRIVQYKQVMTKCVEQAEILNTALKIIKKVAKDDFDLSSISDHSYNYVSLFE